MDKINDNPYIAFVDIGRSIHRPDFSKLAIYEGTGIKLVAAYNDYVARYNGATPYGTLRTALLQFAEFGNTTQVDFQCSKSVTNFLYNFRTYLFTTTNLESNLPTRNQYWMIFRGFIKHTMFVEIIAEGLIPPGNPKLNNRNVVRQNNLLETMELENPVDEKSVITISLSRNDDDYLEELEAQYAAAHDAFLTTARREIDEIKRNLVEGKRLASEVDWTVLQDKIDDSMERGKPFKDRLNSSRHLFRHNHIDFIPNALSYINNKHDGLWLGHKNCGLNSTEDPALKYLSQTHDLISADIWDGYLGRVTTRKLVPFFVYFLIRFPNFRMYSLLDIEIEDKFGQQTIVTSVGENGDASRITIDKKRAHDEKAGYMDEEAQAILDLLIELTTPFRRKLKHANNPEYKILWLVVNGGDSFGDPRAMNHKALRRTFGLNAGRIESGTLARNDLSVAKHSFLASHKELAPYISSATLKKLPPIAGIIECEIDK